MDRTILGHDSSGVRMVMWCEVKSLRHIKHPTYKVPLHLVTIQLRAIWKGLFTLLSPQAGISLHNLKHFIHLLLSEKYYRRLLRRHFRPCLRYDACRNFVVTTVHILCRVVLRDFLLTCA